ncbi:MAG: GTPase ObgE [Armatimonadetes bacterium]|nr:GTPase ObgE [Anaerolineae bacterium]
MIDEVKIYVRSGDGGDGAIAFRREKFIPRGGPSGGDGGHGGDIMFKVNHRMNTLVHFQHKVHFKAKHGVRGGQKDMTGASADEMIIEVPPGTVVKDAQTGNIMADLVQRDTTYMLLRGGRGGRGNARFATSSNQAPRFAEKGEPGTERWVVLELKLIADIGIVGVPNAGKSTLLSVVSNAKPKIANYPFTTLEPNLGVAVYGDRDLVLADIPGLIEGAHQGVGLGHSFLRHVQRCRVLIHLINGESENPLADYSQINTELALFDEQLAQKPQLVVFNKMDLPEAQERWRIVEPLLRARGVNAIAISAAAQTNVTSLMQQVFGLVESLPPQAAAPVAVATPLYELGEDEFAFEITRDDRGAFHVTGRRIERAAMMTYWDYDEAVLRFQKILETLGVSAALENAGVKVGDTVFIGEFELEWTD